MTFRMYDVWCFQFSNPGAVLNWDLSHCFSFFSSVWNGPDTSQSRFTEWPQMTLEKSSRRNKEIKVYKVPSLIHMGGKSISLTSNMFSWSRREVHGEKTRKHKKLAQSGVGGALVIITRFLMYSVHCNNIHSVCYTRLQYNGNNPMYTLLSLQAMTSNSITKPTNPHTMKPWPSGCLSAQQVKWGNILERLSGVWCDITSRFSKVPCVKTHNPKTWHWETLP